MPQGRGRKGHGSLHNCRIPFRGGSCCDSTSWFALVIYGTINVIPDCNSTCVFVFFFPPLPTVRRSNASKTSWVHFFVSHAVVWKRARLISHFGICFCALTEKQNSFSDSGAFARSVSVSSGKSLEELKPFMWATTWQQQLFSREQGNIRITFVSAAQKKMLHLEKKKLLFSFTY